MLVGYNTNISYKGTVYHVQTEDSGIRNPHIITLLYVKGTILASKKSSYAHLAAQPDYKDSVRELMKNQHKAMIKELISGKYSVAAPSPVPDTGSTAPQETQEAEVTPAGPTTAEQPAQTADAEQKEAAPPAAAPEEASQDGAKGQISRSLDDILLDYIIKGDQ